jgi:hypothetical protein
VIENYISPERQNIPIKIDALVAIGQLESISEEKYSNSSQSQSESENSSEIVAISDPLHRILDE